MKRIGDTGDDATRRAIGALLDLYKQFHKLVPNCAVGGGIAVAHWIGPQPDLGTLNTADVDVVVDVVVADAYKDLRQALLKSGLYIQRNASKKPYAYWRKAATAAQEVEIDFQGSPIGGARPLARGEIFKEVGDLKTRILEGGDLALKHAQTASLVGTAPGGEEIRGEARIVAPFILVPLKAQAFRNRGLPKVPAEFRTYKDAADLFALLRRLGPETLAQQAQGLLHRDLLKYAIEALRAHFGGRTGPGGEGVDAIVEYVQGRIPEAALRGQMVDLASRYLETLHRQDK